MKDVIKLCACWFAAAFGLYAGVTVGEQFRAKVNKKVQEIENKEELQEEKDA